ncbi:MAG TPA: hypothetical protein VFB58_00755 [Chloroflexota bacterium]|nr:hypothetical protein [Chloroflexota bacterium]
MRLSPVQLQRLLPVIRVAWVIIAAVSIALFIAAMPRYYHQALTLTNQDGFIARNPAQWRVGLHQLGLSPTFYAAFAVGGRSIMALSLVVTGFVIFLRRSRDWFALFMTLSFLVFGCTAPPANMEFGASPAGTAVNILSAAGESFLIVLYLFPDGRFVPRWTRWCAVVIIATFLPIPNMALTFTQLGLGVTLVIAPIYRYRRVADATQRQQMKWALFGLSLAFVTLVLLLVLEPLAPSLVTTDRARVLYDFATLAATVITFSLVPICIGIAVLRYHLWEIDTLVSRTLVYGSLTLSLGALYIAGVIGLQALARVITGQSSDVAIAVATLAVAALFNPWRRQLQAFIDRRFYRRKYDAARTLAAFNARLPDEVDVDRLSGDLLGVLHDTVQPAHAAIWLADWRPGP